MSGQIYKFYKNLANADSKIIRDTQSEFEDILGMKVDDEIFGSMYLNARYLPGFNSVPPTILKPLFLKSKFRLPLAANFLYKKFSRRIVNNESCKNIVNQLSDQGYYVIENFLKPDEVEKIKDELTHFDYVGSTSESKHKLEQLRKITKLSDQNACSVFSSTCSTPEIDASSKIGNLMIDPFFADIASSYFQTQAYLTRVVSMFTTARDPKLFTDSHAYGSAQGWHFDYSDFRFLKFFIYLTDVTPENGPHTFAAGSHEERLVYPTNIDDFGKTGFRKYVNGEVEGSVKNEWVIKNIGPNRIKEFACPKGTLIIENTSGLHKGGNCTSGTREMLIYDYAISNLSSPHQLPTLDYNPNFPYNSHLVTVLKSLKQEQTNKAAAFKSKYTIKQRIRGKIITTFNLKGLTVD